MAAKKSNGRRAVRTVGVAKRQAGLRLVRVEAPDGAGLLLVFDDEGTERRWRLDAATPTELFALLLRGRMRRGMQVVAPEASVSLDPAPDRDASPDTGPELCASLGMLDICVPMRRSDLKRLRAEIEAALRQ